MDATTRQEFSERLERQREALIAEGDHSIAPNREDAGSVKTDEDAQPLNEMHQAIASKLNAERTLKLRRINAAITRLARAPDDFGLCEACDEDIASKRMALMPWAQFCVACQAKQDPELGGKRSHLTDYV